ncbi:MAG TPA: hypothetical protein VJH22_01385 [Candidatus Nanoarchaeia archaeon]|nr:hypothetical protein [Candidatus Nanoarchaeia archaeon]
MDWASCLRKREAKPIKPDIELAASLVNTSQNKAKSSDLLPLQKETVSSKISLSYDSVRELLESIALRQGFKIYNHVCYTGFLKEVLKENGIGEEFDELRIIRNDINYYGKEVSIEEARDVLSRLERLRGKVSDLEVSKRSDERENEEE